MIKVLKAAHITPPPPNKPPGPVEPNLVFKIEALTIEFDDDPFEVKLACNYQLIVKERLEQAKRQAALDERIKSFREENVLDIEDKLAELDATLSRRNSEIYIKKSKAMYQQSGLRTQLMQIKAANVSLVALTEPNIHGRDKLVARLREMEPLSPYPALVHDYATIFGRKVEMRWTAFSMNLRDYPMPFVSATDTKIIGCLIVDEIRAPPTACRTDYCIIGNSVTGVDEDTKFRVSKGMTPMRVFHDLRWASKDIHAINGSCLEPVLGQLGIAVDLLSNATVDPSPPLLWFDKLRLLRHGPFELRADSFTVSLLASTDPYNSRERLDVCMSTARMQWANHKILLDCDMKMFIRTASRFNNSPFAHIPKMQTNVTLVWRCRDSPDDHQALFPTAVEHIEENMLQSWDTFRGYRSHHLEIKMAADSNPKFEGSMLSINPTMLLYAGTCKFLNQLNEVAAEVSRPIRRGPLYQPVRLPRKKTLTMHIQRVQTSITLPGLLFLYYNSPNRTEGVKWTGSNSRAVDNFDGEHIYQRFSA